MVSKEERNGRRRRGVAGWLCGSYWCSISLLCLPQIQQEQAMPIMYHVTSMLQPGPVIPFSPSFLPFHVIQL